MPSALAYRPAPVIISWLGFPGDISSAITCRITDQEGDLRCLRLPKKDSPNTKSSIDSIAHFNVTHHLWLRKSVFDAPLLLKRYAKRQNVSGLTFGSASNIIRLTHQTVALWSQVLHAVPRSRLLLDSRAGRNELQQDPYKIDLHIKVFLRSINFYWPKNSPQYLIYHKIDITLDPYPCNVWTNDMWCFMEGTPVITLAGKKFASRIGRSWSLYHANHQKGGSNRSSRLYWYC